MPFHLDAGAVPIAGYTLVRRLGRGGFGEVWEAIAPGGVHVALKFIHLDTNEAGAEQRALEIIRDIRHPHLLDVQFAIRLEDSLVIAMPLCDQSMMDRLRACQALGLPGVPREELLGDMEELARAVDFLNEPNHQTSEGARVGVQHRDIKPHNIFRVGGSVRLADFGLAKVLEASSASHTGSMSPNYVAPEMLEGRVSQWSDQYSLAVTYVQLRTGRLPFAGSTVNQILYAHMHSAPDLAVLPAEERRVVARALAKRPLDRWPSCRAFVLGLVAAARKEDGRLELPSGTTLITPESIAEDGTKLLEPPGLPSLPQTLVDDGQSSSRNAVAPGSRRRRLRRIGLTSLAAGIAILSGIILIHTFGPQPTDPDDEPIVDPAKVEAARSGPPIESTRAQVTKLRPVVARVDKEQPPVVTEPGRDRPGSVPEPVPFVEETPPVEPSKPLAKASTRTEVPDPGLGAQAHALLKKYCYRCHGVRFEVPGYNVLDRDILVARRDDEDPIYVVPGKPDASYLWDRVGVDRDMPPSGPKPSDEERALIARWIEAGAPFPEVNWAARPCRTERDVLAAIRDHLRQARPSDRVFLRYFTLHNLYNNKDVDDAGLRLARAAVAKLINSLSWKSEIVVPQSIDREQVVLAIDIRDVDWEVNDLWEKVITRYPYGLKHDQDADAQVREWAVEVYEMAGTSMPFVRADWFVALASRPPLYHDLLGLPEEDRVLEEKLKVDVKGDFRNDKLARAGFAGSGVSSQNRLVDRHPALYGAYWKSYDFKKNEGTSNLFRFPLGPVFTDNPYPHQAFEHSGGEILFNLPNGLQGYLLVDGGGRRIDAGPIEVVSDALKTAGTAAIVPGLSCMACHQHGVIALQDTVRDGLAVSGEARDKAQRLFLTREAMDRLLARDEARFRKALDEATGAFLKVGEDQKKTIRDFPEPIGAVARDYLKDIGLDEVAAELGVCDPKALAGMIQANSRLRQFGLAPLLRNATIKRTEWDSLDKRFLSRFQEVARELELGTPFRSF